MAETATRRLRLDLAYDGSPFEGWQSQARGDTVGGRLEAALERVLDHRVRLVAAGRTDSGVHALQQVVHCDTPGPRTPAELRAGLNSLLPESIRVWEVREAEPDFHARHSAVRREYRYQAWLGGERPPFLRHYAGRLRRPLELEPMRRAAGLLEGHHDFSSFRASGCVARSPERTLERCDLALHGRLLVLRCVSRGFLRQQVRNMVGTLFAVGEGRMEPDEVARLLAARDRRQAPPAAPAEGLYLCAVGYRGEPAGSLEGPPEPVVTSLFGAKDP